jgi:hypothetical protein
MQRAHQNMTLMKGRHSTVSRSMTSQFAGRMCGMLSATSSTKVNMMKAVMASAARPTMVSPR